MADIAISRIKLDGAGQLRLHPRHGMSYAHIYRAALSVRWDEAEHSLYVLPTNEFTLVDEFNQIRKAVQQEYGDILRIDDSTDFAVSAKVEQELRQSIA